MARTTTSIRLPDEVARDLDALAQATERNRNYLITQAVREFVTRETWHLQRIREGLRQLDAGESVPDAEMEAFWTSWTTPEALAEARKIGTSFRHCTMSTPGVSRSSAAPVSVTTTLSMSSDVWL